MMANKRCPECGGRMEDRGRWGWQCFGECRQAPELNPYKAEGEGELIQNDDGTWTVVYNLANGEWDGGITEPTEPLEWTIAPGESVKAELTPLPIPIDDMIDLWERETIMRLNYNKKFQQDHWLREAYHRVNAKNTDS